MPASGTPLVVFIVGLVLAASGFCTVFAVLGRHGGLAKSRTFEVISKLPRPSSRVFALGVAATVLGGMLTCGGVAAGDAVERRACESDCRAAGHEGGRFGPAPTPSTAPSRAARPIAMCWCSGPAGSVVLRPARR
jgi:hypothetical protein